MRLLMPPEKGLSPNNCKVIGGAQLFGYECFHCVDLLLDFHGEVKKKKIKKDKKE
jgi:hypothetical protein